MRDAFRQWARDYTKIGSYTKRALVLYLLVQHPPESNGYLMRVLCNDLKGAVQTADDDNLVAIPALINWLHNYASPASYGSLEKVQAWLNRDGPIPICAETPEGIEKLGEIGEFNPGEIKTALEHVGIRA